MGRARIKDEDRMRQNTEEMERDKLRVCFVNTTVGYGVFAKTAISQGELLVEYRGQLLTSDTDIPDTTYTYYFQHQGKEYCIDATNNVSVGRFINDLDWKTKPNCKIRKVIVDGVPRLGVFALKDIVLGSELRYDYGCRDAPWRKHQKNIEKTYKEPEFLHAIPEIVVISKSGEDSNRFKMVKPFCRIGSARNCCIILSKPGVKDVHIQLELCNGELFLTDFCDRKERPIGSGETFSVLDRDFRVEISKEESVDTDKPVLICPLQADVEAEIGDEFEDEDDTFDDHNDDDDDVRDPDFIDDDSSETSTSEDDVDTEKTFDTEFRDVVCPTQGKLSTSSTQKDAAADSMEEMSEIIEPSCEEIERPLFPQLIVVDKVKRNTKGSLSNKKHCCAYCEKLYPNIARHLSLKHKNEIAVGKILALPKKSKERRKLWDGLVKKGDFAYNYDILTTGKGTIIPKYRAKDAETTIKNVLPCQYCHGMYRRKELWRHRKSCKSRDSSSGNETGPIAGGKKLLPVTCSDKAFHDNIILNIKEDEVKLAILSDQTILDYGLNMYNDQGHQMHKHVYISQKMRELGRLHIAGKKNNIKSIEDCIKNENWDSLILSVREVSEFNPETKNFGIPSLAMKLGQSLKFCAEDMYFKALKVGDTVKQEVGNTFLEMYRLRWRKEISGKALNTLDTIKYNRPKLLPLVEDVAKLNNYIKEKCEHVMLESESSDVYREFCQLCLAQIIVFNRKRSGEAERMTVSQFKKAKVGGMVDPVIMSTLTDFEQTLCKSYLRVEIVD